MPVAIQLKYRLVVFPPRQKLIAAAGFADAERKIFRIVFELEKLDAGCYLFRIYVLFQRCAHMITDLSLRQWSVGGKYQRFYMRQ